MPQTPVATQHEDSTRKASRDWRDAKKEMTSWAWEGVGSEKQGGKRANRVCKALGSRMACLGQL